MRTTIDGAGRIVVPKSLRELMRLSAGQPLDIVFTDGRLQIEVAPTAVHLDQSDGLPRAVPDVPVEPLDWVTVRDALESTRR